MADRSEDRYFAAGYETTRERERLGLLESLCDPWTVRAFETVGVATGWSCLEVGAGGGSIARWLGDRVGRTGHVVAVDLDRRFLEDLPQRGIEVRCCDITCDEIGTDTYDLVHCRALVMHLADPPAVLARMAAAVKPGGWLVVEEPDYSTALSLSPEHSSTAGFHSYLQTRHRFLLDGGVMDLHYGAKLAEHVGRLGLVEADNAGVLSVERGGSPKSQFFLRSFELVDDAMLAAGAVRAADVADARRALSDPAFVHRTPTMHTVWARRPRSDWRH
jgi:SAM-dependent methyltransferase